MLLNFHVQNSAANLEAHRKKLELDFAINNELGHERLKFNCNQILKFILKMLRLDKTTIDSVIEYVLHSMDQSSPATCLMLLVV